MQSCELSRHLGKHICCTGMGTEIGHARSELSTNALALDKNTRPAVDDAVLQAVVGNVRAYSIIVSTRLQPEIRDALLRLGGGKGGKER